MAFVIIPGSSLAVAPAQTGLCNQGHCIYAANQGAFWVTGLSGTNQLSAVYSTNVGSSWNTPTGSPFTLADAHASEGRSFGFYYASISGFDVLHLCDCTSAVHARDYRWSLGTSWTITNNAVSGTGLGPTIGYPAGLFDSSNFAVDAISDPTTARVAIWPNADTGSSWTPGSASVNPATTSTSPTSNSIFNLGSRKLLYIGDNGNGGTFTQLLFNVWSGSAWSGNATFTSAVTATNPQNWGACSRTITESHVVLLSNNSTSFLHYIYNGTSWSAGNSVPTLAYLPGSSIKLIPLGSNVYIFAFDSSNNLNYSKWVSGTGWNSWTVLEATRSNAPSYVTGATDGVSQIMLAWSEHNGSNYDIIGSTLNTAPSVTSSFPFGASFGGNMNGSKLGILSGGRC